MWRTIASIIAGLVAWGVVVTLLNFGLLYIPSARAAKTLPHPRIAARSSSRTLAGYLCTTTS